MLVRLRNFYVCFVVCEIIRQTITLFNKFNIQHLVGVLDSNVCFGVMCYIRHMPVVGLTHKLMRPTDEPAATASGHTFLRCDAQTTGYKILITVHDRR